MSKGQKRQLIGALVGLAIAAIGWATAYLSQPTITVRSPAVLTAPSDAAPRIDAQQDVCPDTTARVQPSSDPEPPPSPECTATLSPEQLRGAVVAPPSIVHAGPGDPPNGQFPPSSLAPATGCSRGLAKDAAAAWDHVAVIVHRHTGYWLQSNGDASCYRTYPQQVDLRNYWCDQGNCGNAAVPGTSNHGWGLAIDAPPQTVAYVKQYGHGLFGQGYGSCSDAPWEGWHIKYCGGYSGPDPGPYGKNAGPSFHPIKRGSSGDRVETLTRRLALLNAPGHRKHFIRWDNRSRKCGKVCVYGIRLFQRAEHLGVDGVYGPHTNERMNARWHYFKKRHD